MKKLVFLGIAAIGLAFSTSCGSSQVAPGADVVIVQTYCSGPEYMTNATALRFSVHPINA